MQASPWPPPVEGEVVEEKILLFRLVMAIPVPVYRDAKACLECLGKGQSPITVELLCSASWRTALFSLTEINSEG
ncbi:hypothetical protein A4D02_08720 [Niastella koreensis]|uniref:Uncharacterized protein n=1 Tax=Niastella koreensis TaxID=354356 RepID=A0ABX3NWY7_9BACT|nr:hypothetical protein A4D02_08720 [Niastella koreensis]